MSAGVRDHNRAAYLAWLSVCVIWGTTYLAIRVALETIPPALVGAFRYLAAGGALALILRVRGVRLPAPSHWNGLMLLGFLMMVTRRNAVSQVVGFMSLENGLILAAAGAKGMPLVVEMSVAFSVLVAFLVIGIFLFRIRERFDSVDIQALDRFRGER